MARNDPLPVVTVGDATADLAVLGRQPGGVADADPSWRVLRNVSELHLELTSVCNLTCSYCYAEVLRPGKDFPRFPMAHVRRTMDLVAASSRKDHIEIIFHGGEPLLHEAAWYEEACTICRETLAAAGKSCEFGLQSNLVLLRDDHVDVFTRHGVKVGTSLDGPRDIHDRVRGRWQSTVRNVRRLVEAGVFSGAIAVVHHHNWDRIRDLYDSYYELGIRSFHLNVASAVGHGAGARPLGADQILQVLSDNLDQMIRFDGEMVETRLLAKIKRHVAKPGAADFLAQLKCDNPFCHAGVNMVVVKYTGEIFPCGCAGSSGNVQRFLLGSVEHTIVDVPSWKSMLVEFHAKPPKYEEVCRSCPARFICEHGCPAFDMNDPVTPDNHCAATRKFREVLDALPASTLKRLASFVPGPPVGGVG